MTASSPQRVVTYTRENIAFPADHGSVAGQQSSLEQWLCRDPSRIKVGEYLDRCISGLVPFRDRPGGHALLRDARCGLFDEVWVVRLDRMGRDVVDLARTCESLTDNGIRLVLLHDQIRRHAPSEAHR